MTDPNFSQPPADGQNPNPGQPYGAPQDPYGATGPAQYGAAPQYGAPQYGAPQTPMGPAGYPLVTQQELSDITLNLWLSVFFGWIPALIFYVIRRDTATPLARKAYADNLNFQLVCLIIYAASYILMFLIIGMLTIFVPFILAIINAATVPGQLRAGQPGKFLLAPNWVK